MMDGCCWMDPAIEIAGKGEMSRIGHDGLVLCMGPAIEITGKG